LPSLNLKPHRYIKYIFKKTITLCLCSLVIIAHTQGQSPITQIGYSSRGEATFSEKNIKGAGYSFSQWTTASNFTIDYASSANNDVESVVSFNIAGTNNFIPITFPNTVIKVRRSANAAINSDRNFISFWSKCSSCPAAGALSGTFSLFAPKVSSMEESLFSNNINSGYDNIFNNTTAAPHYGNVERIDYITPFGFIAFDDPSKAGFTVFDRGGGDSFKIAAIIALDPQGNPSAYKTLITVPPTKFTAGGLLPSSIDYAIIISDPDVAGGEFRPSTKSSQNIKGVYISLQDLGISINEPVYGYSLFGQDVNPALGHVLTDHTTFPVNSSFGGCLDPLNVATLFQSGIVVLPVKLNSFTGFFNKRNSSVDLSWTTVDEQGLKYFEVEKSLNSVDWNTTTTLNTTGNNAKADYFYADKVIKYQPVLYYRLKMTGIDNSVQYSNIIHLNFAPKNEIDLLISQSNLTIRTGIKTREAYLVDMSGKKVQSIKEIPEGADFEFSLNSLPTGMYIVLIIDVNNKQYSKKFIKI